MKLSIEHIQNSIDKALKGESNLEEDRLSISGFSTPTIRRLFNNLCNLVEATYLEIGLFCGASFCASFNKNCTAIGVEDHSQDFSAGFENVKRELKENLDKFSNIAKEVNVHYVGCFNMPDSAIPDGIVDIYSYDGWHSEEHQAKALSYFIDKMANKFAWLIDDWNWSYVRSGTDIGLSELKDKIEIEKEWTLGEGLQNHHVWHNGLKIYLINKK